MSTNLPTASATADDAADLREQVALLTEINDDLLKLVEAQRIVYQKTFEDVLLTFAAKGYRPAAQALLMVRRVFDDAKLKARH